MSIVIGLNSNHADSSVSIFENNKLIFALEEERINRKKHWAGVPIESIKLGLKYCNIETNKVSLICLNTNPFSNYEKKVFFFLKNYLIGKKKTEIFLRQKKKFDLKNILIRELNLNKKIKLKYIDHHLSHLASAYYPSKFKKAIGLSIDGFGDFCSLAIAKCENNSIDIIEKVYFPHSLGVFYEAMTQFIGFDNYGEEYKMMGLASYGQPIYKDLILKTIFKEKSIFSLNLKYFNHYKKNFVYNFQGSPKQEQLFNDDLYEVFGTDKLKIKDDFELRSNIACSAQKVFEFYLNKIIKKILELNYSKNLVFAGGCALNSLANKSLFDKGFDNIYIPYAPADAGGAIGSVLCFLSSKYKNFENLKNPYIGPSYNDDEIKKVIDNYSLNEKFIVQKYDDDEILFDKICNLLIQKKIIGFFNDRMEFGARALGNRSILANPCFKDMKEIINSKIKRRENFRPFAPSVIAEKKGEWFKENKSNPYMSSVEDIIPNKIDKIPAVAHIDGTGRVQSVSKDSNIRFYNLIKIFESKTNVPILLNTSFNENEPIVMTPKEAMDCFVRTDMDAIVLNNILIIRS